MRKWGYFKYFVYTCCLLYCSIFLVIAQEKKDKAGISPSAEKKSPSSIQEDNLLGDKSKLQPAILSQELDKKEWRGQFSNGWSGHFWDAKTVGILWYGETKYEPDPCFGIINYEGKSSGEIFSRKVKVKQGNIYKFLVFYKTLGNAKGVVEFRFRGELDIKLLRHDATSSIGKAWQSKGDSFNLVPSPTEWSYFRCKYEVTRGEGELQIVFKNISTGEKDFFLFKDPILILEQ